MVAILLIIVGLYVAVGLLVGLAFVLRGARLSQAKGISQMRRTLAQAVVMFLFLGQRCISVTLSITTTGTLGRPPLADVLR